MGLSEDSYINRINNLPVSYEECKDMVCPSCGEQTVYGDYVEDTDYDIGGIHNVFTGKFTCVNCNYNFNL